MEKVQLGFVAAARRASRIKVDPQTKNNLQGIFLNFFLIVICLLFIYILVLLL